MMCSIKKLTHIAVTHIVYFFQCVLRDLELGEEGGDKGFVVLDNLDNVIDIHIGIFEIALFTETVCGLLRV